jgi:hypothetical protein
MNAHVRWSDPVFALYRKRVWLYRLTGAFILVTWLMMAVYIAWSLLPIEPR